MLGVTLRPVQSGRVIVVEGESNGNLIYSEGISLRERIPSRDRSRPDVRKILVGAHSKVEL
jgi:hypothetical protein